MFVLAVVSALITLAGLVARPLSADEGVRRVCARAALVAGLVAAVLLVFSSAVVVSTKNIGVVTSFGRPTGELGNGLHAVPPWRDVHELDGAIQINNHADKDAPKVRLQNNSTADVDVSVRWRIRTEQAPALYRDYRVFDSIRDNLVTRELFAALNEVLSGYNPLAPGAQGGADLDRFSREVADRLRARVGAQVEILNVIIPLLRFDQSTQDKINAYQAEIANTRIAEQRVKTAEAEADANRELAESVAGDPNVLVSKCLDVARATGQSTLGCWPGTGARPLVRAGK